MRPAILAFVLCVACPPLSAQVPYINHEETTDFKHRVVTATTIPGNPTSKWDSWKDRVSIYIDVAGEYRLEPKVADVVATNPEGEVTIIGEGLSLGLKDLGTLPAGWIDEVEGPNDGIILALNCWEETAVVWARFGGSAPAGVLGAQFYEGVDPDRYFKIKLQQKIDGVWTTVVDTGWYWVEHDD